MRRVFAVVAAGLLATGCSTTVPGTPVADPSSLAASLDVGSFPTTPREIQKPSPAVGRTLEASRLADTAPFLTDIDPALRYNGKVYLGAAKGIALGLSIGDSVADAVGPFELGFVASADDVVPGSKSTDRDKSMVLAVIRKDSAAAAKAAAASPAFVKPGTGINAYEKKTIAIPGFPDAQAYSTYWEYNKNTTIMAITSSGEYVIAVYTSLPAASVADAFGKQRDGLAGFDSTPIGELTTLPADPDHVVALTLPDDSAAWATPRSGAARTDDITTTREFFEQGGVDVIGYGDSTVYRASGDDAATKLARQFADRAKGFHPEAAEPDTRLAPGAHCLTYPEYSGAKSTETSCWIAVGRYVSGYSDKQELKAVQATNASYQILHRA